MACHCALWNRHGWQVRLPIRAGDLAKTGSQLPKRPRLLNHKIATFIKAMTPPNRTGSDAQASGRERAGVTANLEARRAGHGAQGPAIFNSARVRTR
jgi:hypothetical protein